MTDIEDIGVALRNAIERGQSINSAKQSLKNAGYSDAAVNSAADTLMSNVTINPQEFQKVDNTVKKLPEFNPPVPSDYSFGKKPANMKKFALLIIILLILGGALAYFLKSKL